MAPGVILDNTTEAPDRIARVWQSWMTQNGIVRDVLSEGFEDVLSIGRTVGDAPIRSGLLLMSRAVFDRAGRVDGERAYHQETDGTQFLAAPWDKACAALRDAALAFGASDHCDASDRVALCAPLRQTAPDLVALIEGTKA